MTGRVREELMRAAGSVRWRLVAGGLVAAALAGVVIALWSLHAGDWDNGLGWERTLLLRMHSRLPTVLDDVMLVVPWTGTNWSLFPVALILAWRSARVGRGDIGVHLLTVTAGSAGLNSVLKLAFDRPRPELWEHRGQHAQASFPSGHMIASISVLLTFALLLHRESGWRWPYLAVAVLTILSLYSRLYLGVHWPTDVIAGIASGTVWLVTSWRALAPRTAAR